MTPDPKTLTDETTEDAVDAGADDVAVVDTTAEAVEQADTEVDADGVDADETDTEEPATTVTGSPRRWGRVVAGVLAILLVASAGLTAWLYFHTYRPDQQTNQAAAQVAVDAAKVGTVAALSYSPEHLDADLATAKSHLTGEFLKYYTDFTDQVVRPAVKQKQVSTTANVVRAAVSEMNPDNATVLVFVNQTTTSADRADPSMATSSVVVKLTKVDGNWLISEFNPI